MARQFSRRLFAAVCLGFLAPSTARGQRRRARVARRPRTRIVVHARHPIRRAAALNVVVRPARRTVVVGAPLVFLPVITFAAAAVALPARDRLAWQDTETLERDEDWVEANFGVDDRGDALFLEVDGRAQMNFADVTFENGEVQTVDFDERDHVAGTYRLYNFPGVRNVKTVRLVARARSDEATLRLYLSR